MHIVVGIHTVQLFPLRMNGSTRDEIDDTIDVIGPRHVCSFGISAIFLVGTKDLPIRFFHVRVLDSMMF